MKKKIRRRTKENESTLFLQLDIQNRICVKCGRNQIYQDIKTMDWCEPCLWEFVKEDSPIPKIFRSVLSENLVFDPEKNEDSEKDQHDSHRGVADG